MKVQWTEFNSLAYSEAQKNCIGYISPRDYETTYTGTVIDTYHTFFGTPKFVVSLENGDITSVSMLKCKIIK